jgi:hypothetical protein
VCVCVCVCVQTQMSRKLNDLFNSILKLHTEYISHCSLIIGTHVHRTVKKHFISFDALQHIHLVLELTD